MNSTGDFLNNLSRNYNLKILTDSFSCECYNSDFGKSIRNDPIAVVIPKVVKMYRLC